MKGVTQTLLLEDAPRLGNCLPAAVATFLGRDLEAVPHFIEWEQLVERPWLAMMMGYMAGAGGLWPTVLDSVHDARPGEVVFVAGPGPRGVMHQVLYRDGELAWDPHPSRDGLLEITEVVAWRPTVHDHGGAS